MHPATRTTAPLILAVMMTACSASPPRDAWHRGDSGYRGDGGRGDTLGGFGGPAPRVGESPTPRIPAGMQVRPRQGQSFERTRNDRELCAQLAAIEPQSATERGYYERAVAGCLEARGYDVR